MQVCGVGGGESSRDRTAGSVQLPLLPKPQKCVVVVVVASLSIVLASVREVHESDQ
jgi:hypothetical protein